MVSENSGVPDNFGAQVKSALFWRSGSQIVAQIIAWSSTLIVIRLLSPSDYGLFALTQVVLALLTAFAGYGFARSLVQADSVTPKMIRQTLGLLILLNGGMAVAQYIAAPYIASYYGQPMVADLLRLQTLIFLANPFALVSEVLLSRDLRFRPQAIVNLGTAILGAVAALAMALAGFGVWTLVITPILSFWARAIGLALVVRLKPIPSFDFRGTGDMVTFGMTLLGSHLLIAIQTQSDIFLSGRKFDTHAIGLYSEALFLVQIFINKFIPPLNDVAFPAYARIQGDTAATRWAFMKSLRLIFLVAAPIFLGLAATAKPLILTLFGPKWGEMAPYVAILGLIMPFLTFQALIGPLNNALGRPDINMKCSLLGVILFPACVLVGLNDQVIAGLQSLLKTDGKMIGVVCAWFVSAPLIAWFGASRTRAILHFSYSELLQAVRPGLVPAFLMGAMVYGLGRILPPLPAPVTLGLLVTVGAALYSGLLWLLHRSAVDEIIGMVRKKKAATQ